MKDKEVKEKKITLCQEEPFFHTVEGEGSWMGRLVSYMRTSGCNLRCSWMGEDGPVLCDTAYTSHSASKHVVTVDEAYHYLYYHGNYASISGGEPFLQANVIDLIDKLETNGKQVKVETNGTIFRPSKATLICLSPKLASSSSGLVGSQKEKHDKNRYNLESLKQFMEYYGPERYIFKFVVNSMEDMEEIKQSYIQPLNIPHDKIWLMPMGIKAEALNEKAQWIIEDCCKPNGYNFSHRMHIVIYGNKVGV